MPWYVFRCRECGEQFTTLAAWNRKAEVTCPRCGASRLEEQMSQYSTSSTGRSSPTAAAHSRRSCG